MCGIVGVAGNIGPKADKAFKNLLILDSLRGIDSTGIAAIGRDGTTKVVKQLGNPFELFDTRGYAPAINRFNRAIIGHNRFATQGEVVRRNAHPFDFDTLVGVHNGTLRNKHKLLDANAFKVDSENLYHHIEQEGLDSFLDIVDGAYALVWWDKVAEELNFLRNEERPMWIVRSKDDKMIFWASERWMLEVSLAKAEIEPQEFHHMTKDMHYRFPINDKGELAKPIIKEAKAAFVPVPFILNKGTGAKGTGTTVVPFKQDKKKDDDSTSLPSATKKFYVNSRGVALELDSLCQDKFGAKYIKCVDPLEPALAIRLYYTRVSPWASRIGDVILADIADIKLVKGEGVYYKVAGNSIKEIAKVDYSTKDVVEALLCEPADDGEYKVLNHRGKFISQEEFVVEYGTCASCTGYVDPQKSYKFCTNGEAVCHECLADPEVAKYLPTV